MDYSNPFSKRAAEYLRDDDDFLSLVTPDTLDIVIKEYAINGVLYDRLVQIIGTPGSGKTTIARIVKFSTVKTLLNLLDSHTSFRALVKTLHECRILEDNHPRVLACRLPMEGEYRDFWEFPYPEDIKSKLMFALLEARAILGWINEIERAGINLDEVSIIPRSDAHASLESIGGEEARSLKAKALEVEAKIYNISAALLPPPLEDIEKEISKFAYRPLDVISGFKIACSHDAYTTIPLVIFDDAHFLHPEQFYSLQRWLLRREISVARWVMTRLDALSPLELFGANDINQELPGIIQSREMTLINFQNETHNRNTFRMLAQKIADRYLRQMSTLNGNRYFSNLLSEEDAHLSNTKLSDLKSHTLSTQKRCHISDEVAEHIQNHTLNTSKKYKNPAFEDELLAVYSILYERYAKRNQRQFSLLGHDIYSSETSIPEVSPSVIEGARVHLAHKYGRPLYFGLQALCAASSENTEQFLQLASVLVSLSEAKAIRKHNCILSAKTQDDKLRMQATSIINNWNFPNCTEVRKLVMAIASDCKKKSLEPNASLGGGPIGIGIEQQLFNRIPKSNPILANILKYAVAYNALSIVPNHKTKDKIWCLLELNGVILLHAGLTLKRGGFLERDIAYLNRILGIR